MFRSGNHNLPVSKRRYDRDSIPKLCTFCLTGEQGDEYHYVRVCPLFSEDRNKMIKSYYRVNPNLKKFLKLMCSCDTKVLLNLVKFFKKILRDLSSVFEMFLYTGR